MDGRKEGGTGSKGKGTKRENEEKKQANTDSKGQSIVPDYQYTVIHDWEVLLKI